MRTKKPAYGLCDAPRAWFVEATRRLTTLGFVQHPLDACLFLLFGPDLKCAIGLHVDDLMGISDPTVRQKDKGGPATTVLLPRLPGESRQLRVPRCTDLEDPPRRLLLQPRLLPQQDQANSPGEGQERRSRQPRHREGVQSAATQTSPHLQVHTSMLAGEVSKATVSTLLAANKSLRFANANADVQLLCTPLGCDLRDIVFVACSDAAFASDLSSHKPRRLPHLRHPQVHPQWSGVFLPPPGLAVVPPAACCPFYIGGRRSGCRGGR